MYSVLHRDWNMVDASDGNLDATDSLDSMDTRCFQYAAQQEVD